MATFKEIRRRLNEQSTAAQSLQPHTDSSCDKMSSDCDMPKMHDVKKETESDGIDANQAKAGMTGNGPVTQPEDPEKPAPNGDIAKDAEEKFEKGCTTSACENTVWIERSKYISEAVHKVRVHSADGNSEVRYASDEELEVLRKQPKITKIDHILEGTDQPLQEGVESEKVYVNDAGAKASINSYKYTDKTAKDDHYVHIPGKRTTVHSTYDKAHKKITSMGFKPMEKAKAE